MIRNGFRVRRKRMFMALFSLTCAIILLGESEDAWDVMWAVWMAALTVYWTYEFVRMHRAIRNIKASPLYYLMLVQDAFGGQA